MNEFYELGKKHGSDKVTYHKYHEIYDFFLRPFYFKNGSILEIGIDSGCSLNLWLELFKNAFIYGVDIHFEVISSRFNIIKADQSNINDLDRVIDTVYKDNDKRDNTLFFINDDGSHIPEHQLLTFNKLFPLLCEGGIYIIEDVETSYWTKRNGLYGYESTYGYKHPDSIVEIFKDVVDTVNSEYAGKRENRVMHHDKIGSITFSKNCIIIVKRTQEERRYRFIDYL